MFVKNRSCVRMIFFFISTIRDDYFSVCNLCLELAGRWIRASPGPSPLSQPGNHPQGPLGHDPVINLSVDRVRGEHGQKAKGNSTTSNSHCKQKSLNPCMTLIKKGIN